MNVLIFHKDVLGSDKESIQFLVMGSSYNPGGHYEINKLYEGRICHDV